MRTVEFNKAVTSESTKANAPLVGKASLYPPMTLEEQSEHGRQIILRAEAEQLARAEADPIRRAGRLTANERAAIDAAWAKVEPFKAAMAVAGQAVADARKGASLTRAAADHRLEVHRLDGRLGPEPDHAAAAARVSAAETLVKEALVGFDAARTAFDKAHRQAVTEENRIGAASVIRFHKAAEAAAERGARELAEQQERDREQAEDAERAFRERYAAMSTPEGKKR